VPGSAIDEPIALVPASGTTELISTDHHGSIVATSDASGNPIEGPFVYDSWGNCYSGTAQTTPCSTASTSIPFRFTGQYFDSETGCYYYRARMYCADALHGGRFLQTDPVGYDDDLNMYTYVGNDPADRIDPTGLCGTGSRIATASGGNASGCSSSNGNDEVGAQSANAGGFVPGITNTTSHQDRQTRKFFRV
jgi:RHS repeat-associated protein